MLSEHLKERNFSSHITDDGCLSVVSNKMCGGKKIQCAVGKDGEVYCDSKDLANQFRKRVLETVLEEVNKLYPGIEASDAPEQNSTGGMTLG